MINAKKGRGRPAKKPIGIFKLEAEKRPVGRPKKNKVGRPNGSKNKPKWPTQGRSIEQRLDILELGMAIVVEGLGILAKAHMNKKPR